ncbi:hypothetical protein PS624_02657 [Pseudomonas fluorescens]|uniref:Uncharacterized protein n=1 Tax=Pseudomonas fluorescens TaxID=294 RepID=A0A5E6T4Z2_PSEFL|nr:hypothetical protein PS624_02657 [Pseudomonas fluorescens]
MVGGHIGKEGDAITLAPIAVGHLQNAAGADGVMQRFAESQHAADIGKHRFERHRGVANRHEPRGLEHVHQRQRPAGRAHDHR